MIPMQMAISCIVKFTKIESEPDARIQRRNHRVDCITAPRSCQHGALQVPYKRSALMEIPLRRRQEFEARYPAVSVKLNSVVETSPGAFDRGTTGPKLISFDNPMLCGIRLSAGLKPGT
ncbi:hypothetical protein IQ17_07338 [Bradyrhizobium daqingense]|uniref:Uncharacterized protein n=1 Tax=Bradyrhizobium daqingense TaxID=993502 RepID=A0A562K919_9BRAD|nr:hypothetical protein IQ17_07338 [Bradyrhizobium daqingense]